MRAAYLILVLCPLLAAQVQPAVKSIPWTTVAVYAAAEYDAATTYSLRECQKCYEANPVMKPFAKNPSIFAVEGLTAWITNRFAGVLDDNGHPKWARTVQWTVISAHAGAGSWNLTLH